MLNIGSPLSMQKKCRKQKWVQNIKNKQLFYQFFFIFFYFFGVTCHIWLSLLFSLIFLPSSGPSFPSRFFLVKLGFEPTSLGSWVFSVYHQTRIINSLGIPNCCYNEIVDFCLNSFHSWINIPIIMQAGWLTSQTLSVLNKYSETNKLKIRYKDLKIIYFHKYL